MKQKIRNLRIKSFILALAMLFSSSIFVATAQQADVIQTEESPISATQSGGKFLNEISFEGTGEYIPAVYELNDRREENVKHFSMPDGTYRAVVYGEAVHRKDADGKWTDIDNSLTFAEKNGMRLYSDSEGRISFASSAQSSEQGSFLFSLTENGYLLAMALIGNTDEPGSLSLGNITATASVATVTNPAAKEALTPDDSAELQFEKLSTVDNQTEIVYADVLSGIDLEYTLRSNSIKENIVVKSEKESYVYRFEIVVKGLTAALSDDGSITLSDSETNTAVYYIPAPYMTDADGNISHDVAYSLTELSEDSYELIVTASTEWINAEGRAFPVKIDPTVMSNSGIHDTYISNLTDEATNLVYGNEEYISLMSAFTDENGIQRKTIGLIRGNLPSIPETATVTSASLTMNLSLPGQTIGEAIIIALNLTSSWNEDDTSWGDMYNNIGDTATMLTAQITSSSTNLVSLDITPFVQAAECKTENYNGIALLNGEVNGGEIRIRSSESSGNYIITSVTYMDGIEEGVYSIKNLTTNKWLSTPINSGDYTDFSEITQKAFSTDPTANFDNSREALFKISVIPGTTKDRYVLRPMLNNNFVVNYYGGEFVPMFTSAQESSFTDDQTFYIEADANGYTIKTVSTEEFVVAASGSNSVDISYDFDAGEIWQFTRYEGTDKYGVGFNDHPNNVVVGTSVEIVPVVWSTVIDAHTPLVRVQTSDQSIATYSWNSSAQKMTLNPISEGIAQTVIVLYKGDNIYRSVTSKVFSFDVRLPIENGTYFIRNVHSKHYLQIDDADAPNNFSTNNAGLEVWEYDGEDYQKWSFTHISNGEYFIRSEKSGMALTMPTAEQDNTVYPALIQSQFNPDLPTQKWKISITENWNYRISSVYDTSGSYAMGTLISTTEGTAARNMHFGNDSMLYDEWYISEDDFDSTLKINICADIGYTERNPNYKARIPSVMEKVREKYLHEFGILILCSGITIFKSPPDYCDELNGGNFNTPCTCVTDEQCLNASSSGMHHNRDRLYISKAPEASFARVVAFSGHDICEAATVKDNNGNNKTVHAYNSLGSALDISGICIVNCFGSLEEECYVAVHEIGHFYGVPDHNTEETTAYLNSLYPEEENPFANDCIYGVNHNDSNNVIPNILICDGCKSLIQGRKYMYDS